MTARGVQGWQPDPFGLHEARYFSAAGQPTKLVRDRGAESYDEPPSGPDELAAAKARMPSPPVAYAPQGYVPVPRAYPPRGGGSPYRPAAARRPRGRAGGIVGFAASGIILVAIATAAVLVALTLLHPKHTGSAGAGDAALVTQAATKTLQQRTADVVLSLSTATGGLTMHGTGAIDLGGHAGTLNVSERYSTGAIRLHEIWLNGTVYLAGTADGQDLAPKGKEWVKFPISSQDSGGTDLTGGNLTAALIALEKQGITVRALGTKDIGGVSCTGYSVTAPDGQATTTVWINAQDLVREISGDATLADALSNGASASAAPTGEAGSPSLELTMDFTYSAAPLHVTAPPAASTAPSSGMF